MATCNTCKHMQEQPAGIVCTRHDLFVSSYSWCGHHEVAAEAPKPATRISDNPRSAEEIHD